MMLSTLSGDLLPPTLRENGLRPLGMWPSAGQLLTRSVHGGTERMLPYLRLHRVCDEEVDHSGGPVGWRGVSGCLSRQQKLGCELQARGAPRS